MKRISNEEVKKVAELRLELNESEIQHHIKIRKNFRLY